MSFHDFISKNIIDLGDSKKSSPPNQGSSKSFINSGHQGDSNIPDAHYSQPVGYAPPPSTFVSGSVDSSDLESARQKIVKLLDDSNQPGIDFHEYVVAKNGMSAIPVEADRYKIAFSSLAPIGLTKDILNKSGIYYISVVDNELKNFENQFVQINKSDVDDKKISITIKQQQIVSLSEQINKLNEEIRQMTLEVTNSEQILNSKRNAFSQACQEAKQTIQTELNNIVQYIS